MTNYEEFNIRYDKVLQDPDLKLSYKFSNNDEDILFYRLKSFECKLKNYCDIYDGINPGSVEIKNTLITNRLIDKYSKKIIDGKDFSKYSPIQWDGSYIYYNKDFVNRLKEKIKRQGNEFTARIIKKVNFFERKKIITRQTAESIIATIDDLNFYVKNTVHSSLIKKEYANDIASQLILGILNSSLIDWYYRKESMEEGRLFPQVKIGRLENLPFPPYKEMVKFNKKFVELVNQVISTKQFKSQADTTILEKQIDAMVCKLYDLEYKEVKIVDQEFSMSELEYEQFS